MAHILFSVLEALGFPRIQHFIIVWADDSKIKPIAENIVKNASNKPNKKYKPSNWLNGINSSISMLESVERGGYSNILWFLLKEINGASLS